MQPVILESIWQISKTLIKREESENKGRIFWLCQKMARLLIFTWDGFLFKPIDAAEITFVVLAEEYKFSCGSRKETRKGTVVMVSFLNSHTLKLFKMQLMMAPFKISNLVTLKGRKLQSVIMPPKAVWKIFSKAVLNLLMPLK